jgi:hypothetical protein
MLAQSPALESPEFQRVAQLDPQLAQAYSQSKKFQIEAEQRQAGGEFVRELGTTFGPAPEAYVVPGSQTLTREGVVPEAPEGAIPGAPVPAPQGQQVVTGQQTSLEQNRAARDKFFADARNIETAVASFGRAVDEGVMPAANAANAIGIIAKRDYDRAEKRQTVQRASAAAQQKRIDEFAKEQRNSALAIQKIDREYGYKMAMQEAKDRANLLKLGKEEVAKIAAFADAYNRGNDLYADGDIEGARRLVSQTTKASADKIKLMYPGAEEDLPKTGEYISAINERLKGWAVGRLADVDFEGWLKNPQGGSAKVQTAMQRLQEAAEGIDATPAQVAEAQEDLKFIMEARRAYTDRLLPLLKQTDAYTLDGQEISAVPTGNVTR